MGSRELEFFMWHLNYITDQIKMADNKMNFLLAIYLSLIGVVTVNIQKIFDILGKISWRYKCFFFIDLLILLGCVTGFIFLFINAVSPRIDPRKILSDENYISIIFWGDLSKVDMNEFKNIKMESFVEDLQKQILINARIAERKFNSVKNAYNVFLPTFISFLIFVIFLIFGR